MRRIDIYYDGRDYSVGHSDLDALVAEVDAAAVAGSTIWLEVNSSFGQARPTLIRVTPSSNIAFTAVAEPANDSSTPEPATP